MACGYLRLERGVMLSLVEVQILGALRRGAPARGISGLCRTLQQHRRTVQRSLDRLQALQLVVVRERAGCGHAGAELEITELGRWAARAARDSLFGAPHPPQIGGAQTGGTQIGAQQP